MIRKFARPYARAIMEVTETSEAAQSLYDELSRFEDIRRESSELNEVFANPAFDIDSRIRVASEIAERVSLSPLAVRVIEVLIRNHRINSLGAILAALQAEINEETGRTVAEVRSAHPLTETQREQLREALEKKVGGEVDLEMTVDESLLGGFVARFGSEIYDASIIGQINRLREELTQ